MKALTCNWVLEVRTVKLCGKAAAATIYEGGYCGEHLNQAEKLFGQSKPIFREELFDR